MVNKKRKIILDVDTGSDDAIAIMAAILSPEFDVVGICTVNGNRPVENTTENTLRVVDLLESDVPVIKGCPTPLVSTLDPRNALLKTSQETHDEEGKVITYHPEYLDTLPPSVSKPLNVNAITWYIDTLMNAKEKITIVPVGPLTNLAVALRAEPNIIKNIEEIVIMGGGHDQRNTTAAAEFNIWADPEAAQIVLTCGAKVTLVTLDATHRACLRPNHSEILRSWGTKVGKFAADMVDERVLAYNRLQPLHEPDIAPIHDALCIVYLLDPTVITDLRFMRVDVVCGGGIAYGQTICDTRARNDLPKNCYVALNTDEKKFDDILIDILSRGK